MRSFGSRADAAVVDEPFYGHYLAQSGREHPGREEILAHAETDAGAIAAGLLGPLPEGRTISYQKHMAHHLLPSVPRAWLDAVRSAFLIRDPAAVLASLDCHLTHITVADTGLSQQVEILRRETERRGCLPPVIDSADLLAEPRRMLEALCAALDISFDPAMLAWAQGARATDGVWGPRWYGEVYATTGFAAPRDGRPREFPEELRGVLDECQPFHAELASHKLKP